MRLLLEEKFNKHIKNEFVYGFDILEQGLYVVEISGRAKSWLQNTLKLISFFKDDDLVVKIDGREFPKLSGEKGLFDSESAWNGNKLKNLSQINVFFVYFEAGKHTLKFTADQSPLLETVKIYQTENEQNVVFEPVKSYQIEKGNRRPWLIFILVDLALERLKIQASANKKRGDDDDLQLKINGERQINDFPKYHKYWYWCGRVLSGQSKIFDKKLNLAADLHYVELWADNTPAVESIDFKLSMEMKPMEGEVGRIALYADIDPEVKTANLRADSNDKSEILKKVPNGARVVITKNEIEGNRPDGYLSDLWHEVLYQDTRGFVHSSLVEIHGQEREKIIDFIQNRTMELGIDIDRELTLNLAHCESKWLPFAHSSTGNKGIYQLGKSTVQFINEKLDGNVSDFYDPYQNIDGGLRYLRYLLERYSGASDYLVRIIAAWNMGPNAISKTEVLNFGAYDPQVQKLVDCVLKEQRGENVLEYLRFLFLPLIIGIGLWALFTSDDFKNLNADKKYLALVAPREVGYLTEGENFAETDILKAREKELEVGYLQTDFNEDKNLEKIVFTVYSPEPFVYYTNIYPPGGEKIIISGILRKALVDDLTGDGIKELIVTAIPAHLSATYIFSYKSGFLEEIPIYDENEIKSQNNMLVTSLEIRFEDLDGDGVKEIVLPIRNYGNEFVEPTYYYRWNSRGFVLYDKRDVNLKSQL